VNSGEVDCKAEVPWRLESRWRSGS